MYTLCVTNKTGSEMFACEEAPFGRVPREVYQQVFRSFYGADVPFVDHDEFIISAVSNLLNTGRVSWRDVQVTIARDEASPFKDKKIIIRKCIHPRDSDSIHVIASMREARDAISFEMCAGKKYTQLGSSGGGANWVDGILGLLRKDGSYPIDGGDILHLLSIGEASEKFILPLNVREDLGIDAESEQMDEDRPPLDPRSALQGLVDALEDSDFNLDEDVQQGLTEARRTLSMPTLGERRTNGVSDPDNADEVRKVALQVAYARKHPNDRITADGVRLRGTPGVGAKFISLNRVSGGRLIIREDTIAHVAGSNPTFVWFGDGSRHWAVHESVEEIELLIATNE